MNNDLDTLARTIYGEAEANNIQDAEAVACVIRNRIKHRNWPSNIASVCLQPYQFSCWNPGDPNRERILNARGTWFEVCVDVARRAIDASLTDMTNGATHYYATYVKMPKWAKGHKPCYEVKHKGKHKHVFFNDIDTKPPETAREALEQARPLGSTGTIKAARAGAAGSASVAIGSEVIKAMEPTLPIAQTLAQYAPWVLVVILLMAIGYMVYRRIDDRAAGLR